MNISILVGWAMAIGLIIFGIVSTGEMKSFIDPSSFAITVGGTIACLIASFPLSYLAKVPKKFVMALMPKKYKPEKYIDQIFEYANVARGRGLLALEEEANKCTDAFLKSALMLIVDANEPEKVRAMLDDAISFMCERHDNGRAFFEKGVGIFPAFGMLGTLVGLINMLASMSNNPDGLAGGMAQALITTFYGSLFANVLFAPIAAALKNSHDEELLCMQIIEEGVLAIAAGNNPRFIREKLEFMLPKSSKKEEAK
ncbi:MAG: motility protein A [Oscillospiraceae bacterium]